MRYSVKLRLMAAMVCAFVLVGVLMLGDVLAFWQEARVKLDGDYIEFTSGEPIISGGHITVPAIDLLDELGYRYGYTDYDGELTIKNNGNTYVLHLGEDEILKDGEVASSEFGLKDCDGVPYVSVREFCSVLGCSVSWDSRSMTAKLERGGKVNPLSDTVISDNMRFDVLLGEYNGYYVFTNGRDRICTEIVDIDDEHIDGYVAAVNAFADAVPDANTYCILVPSSSEFYASSELKSDYLSAYTRVYDKLGDNVTPINAVRPLSKHTDENIFFRTDHHWTQLGAYYVYKEFINYTGEWIDSPSDFEVETVYDYQGSFLEYLENGSGLLSDTYDELTLMYPSVNYTGEAYMDEELSEYAGEVEAIDSSVVGYDCYLDGDYPIEVYKTDCDSGKSLCVVKESFGNAFAVWALNNYSEVYVVDYRCFNGCESSDDSGREFSISEFYKNTGFDDLVIISYPVTVGSDAELNALTAMAK